MSLIALGLLLWPLAYNLATALLVCTPWALAFFANNAAQQGRLASISLELAGASIALNTSAIYVGHAIGAVVGGWWIQHHGIGSLHWLGFVSAVCAIALALRLSFGRSGT
jgi:predicted MFS family arabinose efflux permease